MNGCATHDELFDPAPKQFNGLTFDISPSVCYKDLSEIESGGDVLIDTGKSGGPGDKSISEWG
jgi:hypothetical protein